MKFVFHIDSTKLDSKLAGAIGKVQTGTKKATKQACEEILEDSLQEVPRDTETLAMSGYYDIIGSYRNFKGVVGYGGNGDPVNPKNGFRASEYMVEVHEDLNAYHTVGKAKFLEDPLNRYSTKFPDKARKTILDELMNIFKGG